jgi:DmsE family decaheme c-type cytochrome
LLKRLPLLRVVVFLCTTVCGATLFVFFLASNPELAAQDHERVSEVCLDCHEDQQTSLRNTPHQIPAEDPDNHKVTCTDCHAGDARHYDEDAEEYPMPNPAKVDAWNEAQICSQCHLNAHQQNMQERNVHVENKVNCSGCHRVHVVLEADSILGAGQYSATHYTGLLKNNEVDLCLDCHSDVRGEFAKPTHHPVEEGIVKCSECHMITDQTKKPLSAQGYNDACFQCHSEFQLPFPFEHQATVDFSIQEGSCLNCHEAHGSYLPRLLNQPYDMDNAALCLQCHSVPKHRFNSFHGAQWAGVPCNDCHVDIHGSFTSRYFFSSALQSQNCFNVGCHSF